MTRHRLPAARAAVIGVACATALALPAAPADAATGAAYFDGKTVTYVVATGAGGGFDFYGRLVASYMEQNLPGSTFVVRNMPGAGHMIGTNYIYNARPDGLTIGTFNTAMFLNQILGKKGVKYDLGRMNFLGKASTSSQVLMINTMLPYKTLRELRQAGKRVKMATGGPGSGRWIFAKISESAFGLKFRMIPGYTGPDAHLAMQRGEIDIMMGSVESNEPMVKQGKGRFLAVYATERDPDYPDVPIAYEFISDPEQRSLARLIVTAGQFWRVTGAPPGIPSDRLATLRAAYRAAIDNPKLRGEAEKAGRKIVPAYGEEVDRAFRDALDISPKMAATLKEAVTPKQAVTYLKHTGRVTQTKREGRRIWIDHKGQEVKAKISGSRTKVTINGKADKRRNVTVGMTCTFVYLRPGAEARELICRN